MASTARSSASVDNHQDDFRLYESFYDAVWKGDLKFTTAFIDGCPNAVRAKITKSGRTALHIAVVSGHVDIVEKLVAKMSEPDLEIKDIYGFTALALAATNNANISIAKCMVGKNEKIASIDVDNVGFLKEAHTHTS